MKKIILTESDIINIVRETISQLNEEVGYHGGGWIGDYNPTTDKFDFRQSKARNLGPGMYFSTQKNGNDPMDVATGHAKCKSSRNQSQKGTAYIADLPEYNGENYISFDDPTSKGNISASKILYKFLYRRLFKVYYNDMLSEYKKLPWKTDEETIRTLANDEAKNYLKRLVSSTKSGYGRTCDLVTYMLTNDIKVNTSQSQQRFNSHNPSIRPYHMKENEVVCTSNEVASILKSMGFCGAISGKYDSGYGNCHIMFNPRKDVKFTQAKTYDNKTGEWTDETL